jgi:hypothetical protein
MALAGFTGLIGALRQGGREPLTDRQKLHVTTLLVTSVIVIVFSFVPTWISLLPAAEGHVWEWSMRVLLAVHILAFAITIPFSKLGKVYAASLPLLERNMAHVVNTIGVVAVLVEAIIVFGFMRVLSPFVFEGVMIFFLALGLADFLALLLNPE